MMSEGSKLGTNVGIIIVTYMPNVRDFKSNILDVLKLKQDICVVDNGSKKELIKALEQMAKKYKFDLIMLNKNMGIGYAQNVAMTFFANKNKDYFLFLDQDSSILPEQFNQLVRDFKTIQITDSSIVLLGPALDMDGMLVSSGKGFVKVDKVISSGSLMLSSAVNSVGKFKDEFFIDLIDYEWCYRAARKGKSIYQDNEIVMQHETEGVPRKYGHTIDSEFRLYYIFRNSTYLIFHEKLSLLVKFNLLSHNIGKLLFQFCLDNPFSRIRACNKGIWDGLKNKLTKIDTMIK